MGDGTSVSWGWSNRGELVDGVELPVRGDGYRVPAPWATRGNNWGTEELVGLIVRVGRRLQLEHPGDTLYVADLSPRRGGASAWHRSHQTGRDADLHFFAVDAEGHATAAPTSMESYDASGVISETDAWGYPIVQRRFDVERNWRVVRALLEDPVVEVQFLFISAPLRRLLLEHARAISEPSELVERAAAVLGQPGGALPHDDHLHVRIYCPESDRSLGCRDRGPERWLKKGWKYVAARPLAATTLVAEIPMCRLMPAPLVAGR